MGNVPTKSCLLSLLEKVPSRSCHLISKRMYLQETAFSVLGECTYKELPSQLLENVQTRSCFSTLGESIYKELPSQLLEKELTRGCLLSSWIMYLQGVAFSAFGECTDKEVLLIFGKGNLQGAAFSAL